MQGLITLLKALAVMLLCGAGVAFIVSNWHGFAGPDGIGVGFGVFLLMGGLIAFMRWFARRDAA